MKDFSRTNEEMNRETRLKVLVVYNAWRGSFAERVGSIAKDELNNYAEQNLK